MRRFLKFGLLLLIVGVIGGTIFKMNQILLRKREQAHKLHQRPNLASVRFVSNRKNSPTMINGKPTLIILFNSECEHCQYEAAQLQERHREFAGTNVYLLTTETFARAYTFARHYGLDSLEMVHVGTLTQEEAYQAFGSSSIPHLFIYSSDGQLQKEFKGETKIDALLIHL